MMLTLRNKKEVVGVDKLAAIEQRLIRIESRLVQLMLHIGVDPYVNAHKKDEHASTYHRDA